MKKLSKKTLSLMLKFQKDEMTSSKIYTFFSKRLKDEKNRKIIAKIAADEKEHAAVWEKYTGKKVGPDILKTIWYVFLTYVMGYTFVIKLLESGEYTAIKGYKKLIKEVPEADRIMKQEEEHEKRLVNLLDEERLNYVGAMVLGLNDALVELTGAIAGLTFVLMNTTLIAMAGIITGISATLSMAASNYLAERADGNPKALKASVYTGIAYLITVTLLVLPYLLFPVDMYLPALISMILIVILVIFFFNYYITVVKSERFIPRFLEMSMISLSVALIAFLIGLGAKYFFNIDVG